MEGGESKLVVLVADVSGGTRLRDRLGSAEAMHAVERCIKRMERAVKSCDGRLLGATGHEITATFKSADAAYQSAIEMQQRIADLPPISGIKLAVRIGFQAGPGAAGASETSDTAARLARLAVSGQILIGIRTLADLAAPLRETTREVAMPPSGSSDERVFEVVWQKAEPAIVKVVAPQPVAKTPTGKFCLRYRNRAYLLDERTSVLSLGRDPGCDVIIEDRKASRQHGRIERRGDQFFYVDRSTNGSYVAVAGASETMLRRMEILLRGRGTICFGSSINDPTADCATFEYL